MSDCKLVSISVPVGGGGEVKRTVASRDGKVQVNITEYPYVSAVAKDYLDQGWMISGSNVGANGVVLLLTR